MIRILILAFLFLGYSPAIQKQNTYKFYKVTRVVDGDTFWINDGTKKGQKIRLIGVDAPESRNTGKKVKNPFGDDASAYLKKLIGGKAVRLEYDIGRTDRYGRTLAYVYLSNGLFVNAELVKNGYATVMTVPPNVKYQELFLKLSRKARSKEKGLWAK